MPSLLPPGPSRGGGGGSSGSRGGSLLAGEKPPHAPRRRAAPAKKGGGHHGFFGSIAEPFVNLATGAEQTVLGLYPALKTTGSTLYTSVVHPDQAANKAAWDALFAGHPVRAWQIESRGNPFELQVVQPIAKGFAWKYGPLFQGHPLTTLDRALVKDPFGTAFDIAALFTGGAALAGKVLPAEAVALRTLPLRGPEALARAGRLDEQLGKITVLEKGGPETVSARSIRGTALRHRATHSVLNLFPADMPGVGELRRFNRKLARELRVDTNTRRLKALDYDKALRPLSVPERQAVALLARWPLPRTLDSMIEKWKTTGEHPSEVGALQIATNPEVRAIYDEGLANPKIARAVDEGTKLGEQDAAMLAKYGRLDPETAANAPFLHMRIATGAKFVPDMEAVAAMLESPRVSEWRKSELQSFMETPVEPGGLVPGQVVHAADRQNFGRIVSVGGDSAEVHFISPQGYEATVELPKEMLTPVSREAALQQLGVPTVLEGGVPIADLKAELAAGGHSEPFYLHDTSVDRPKGGPSFQPSGGGTSPVPRSPVFRNEGTLASIGQLLLDPSTLISQHFRSVRYGLFRDIHAGLEQVALRVPRGTKLPEGYQFLRRAMGPTGRTPERIGHVEQTAGEYQRWLEENLPDRQVGKIGRKLGIGKGELSPEAEESLYKELTTKNADDADIMELPNGDRLIVPTSTVRAAAGEFQRSNAAVRLFIERPLDVWRALLLNYSPRWLAGNIVGNSVMGLLRFGGPTYIRAWLAAVAEHAAPGVFERFLRNSGLTEADMIEHFPELVSGTFKGQNMPFLASATAGRARNLLREGLSPIDRTYEQALRRAAANTVARNSPEVQAILKRMPGQTRSFREATKQALEENPALRNHIIQEVNSGLGDFISLSLPEKTWVRRVAPFYAWYRAIAGVALKLPLEVPGRIFLIAHLAQIEQENQDLLNPGLAPWLRGGIPFGRSGIVYTQGINPFATVPQTARGLNFAIHGGDYNAARTFLGLLNPNLQAFPSIIPERGQRSPGLLWTLAKGTYGGVPPVTLTNLARHGAPPSKLYQPSTLDQLLSQLGVPVRHLQQPLNR